MILCVCGFCFCTGASASEILFRWRSVHCSGEDLVNCERVERFSSVGLEVKAVGTGPT